MAETQTHSTFYDCLFTCKKDEDPFENEGARVVKTVIPLKVYADFPLKGSQLHSLMFVLLEIQTHPSLYVCPCNLQE